MVYGMDVLCSAGVLACIVREVGLATSKKRMRLRYYINRGSPNTYAQRMQACDAMIGRGVCYTTDSEPGVCNG